MVDEWQVVKKLSAEQEQAPLHPQDEKLKQERDTWRRKYEQLFDEQCMLRAQLNDATRKLETEEKHASAMADRMMRSEGKAAAQSELIDKLLAKLT